MNDVSLRLMSAGVLRSELSFRALRMARGVPHEATYGGTPSVLFQASEGGHGNFLAGSYRAIVERPEWAARLGKAYCADAHVPRRWDRRRAELDCANSSDALLMNVFCYPGVMEGWALCALLGVERGVVPEFGYKPRIELGAWRGKKPLVDRTEVDMRLGSLLVEAKLTETGFQTAPAERVLRYPGVDEVFCVEELPVTGGDGRPVMFASYQLIRGVMAARACGGSFALLCDARRVDLIERWFRVMRAVRSCEMRSRLALVTWQEIAAVVPAAVAGFLEEKYGIKGSESACCAR